MWNAKDLFLVADAEICAVVREFLSWAFQGTTVTVTVAVAVAAGCSRL